MAIECFAILFTILGLLQFAKQFPDMLKKIFDGGLLKELKLNPTEGTKMATGAVGSIGKGAIKGVGAIGAGAVGFGAGAKMGFHEDVKVKNKAVKNKAARGLGHAVNAINYGIRGAAKYGSKGMSNGKESLQEYQYAVENGGGFINRSKSRLSSAFTGKSSTDALIDRRDKETAQFKKERNYDSRKKFYDAIKDNRKSIYDKAESKVTAEDSKFTVSGFTDDTAKKYFEGKNLYQMSQSMDDLRDQINQINNAANQATAVGNTTQAKAYQDEAEKLQGNLESLQNTHNSLSKQMKNAVKISALKGTNVDSSTGVWGSQISYDHGNNLSTSKIYGDSGEAELNETREKLSQSISSYNASIKGLTDSSGVALKEVKSSTVKELNDTLGSASSALSDDNITISKHEYAYAVGGDDPITKEKIKDTKSISSSQAASDYVKNNPIGAGKSSGSSSSGSSSKSK